MTILIAIIVILGLFILWCISASLDELVDIQLGEHPRQKVARPYKKTDAEILELADRYGLDPTNLIHRELLEKVYIQSNRG